MSKRKWVTRIAWGGANPKADILGMIEELHGRGLGSPGISKVVGYSERYVRSCMRDLNLYPHDPSTIRAAIIAHLPEDVKTKAAQLHVKHRTVVEVRKQAIENMRRGAESRTVHKVFDDEAQLAKT